MRLKRVEVLQLSVTELTPRLADTVVHWRLVDDGERALYDLQAVYTLADFGAGWRITAIAHNEKPHLRA